MGWGLRGGKEPTYLSINNITSGFFEAGHMYAGQEWFGLEDFTDKTHKLSVHNNYKREITVSHYFFKILTI